MSQDESGSTSLASLLMMNEIPQYGGDKSKSKDESDSSEFKIAHSSQDENSIKNNNHFDDFNAF